MKAILQKERTINHEDRVADKKIMSLRGHSAEGWRLLLVAARAGKYERQMTMRAWPLIVASLVMNTLFNEEGIHAAAKAFQIVV